MGTPEVQKDAQLDVAEQLARIEKLKREQEKLKLEQDLLRYQTSPSYITYDRIKTITGAAGIVTAFAAVLGLLASTCQWASNASSTRAVRIEERLDKALLSLGEAREAQRMGAVASLRSFLDEPAEEGQQQRVLVALANMLAVETSLAVRNAIVSALADFHSYTTGELNSTLASLAETSRGLVAEGDLWRKRSENLYITPAADTPEGRVHSIAQAITLLLRRGAKVTDLSGIFLANSDLSGCHLDGVKFDDAVLAWSDFSKSSLDGTSFVGADLERTSFREASLRRARFGELSTTIKWTQPHKDLITRSFYSVDRSGTPFMADTADFSCADLREASFAGFPVFDFVEDSLLSNNTFVSHPDFFMANIAGADFVHSNAYGIKEIESTGIESDPIPFSASGGMETTVHGRKVLVFSGTIEDRMRVPFAVSPNYVHSWESLEFTFMHTNWPDAKMPTSIREHLTRRAEAFPADIEPPCHPKAPWIDTAAAAAALICSAAADSP